MFDSSPDPYESMPRPQFERMVSDATSELTDGDWEAVRQMLVIEWEKCGYAAWVIEPLRTCNPKAAPVVRRRAFDLATSPVGAEQ